MEIHIARDGQQLGPFPLEEVQRQFAAGTLLPTDFAWTEGATGWVPLASFPGLTPPPASAAPVAGPPPNRASMAPPAMPGPAATSGTAITSLVFGILSFLLLPLVGGIVAVICGHIALSAIRSSRGGVKGHGMAVAGLVIGYLNIGFLLCIVPILAGIAVPVFAEVQLKGKEIKSLSNARQIVTACQLYAIDHQEAFPKTLEELVPDYLPDRRTLACPLSPGEPVGYHYFGGTDKDPPGKVLVMSKFKDRHGKRIIVHADGSGAVQLPPPDVLPLGEH